MNALCEGAIAVANTRSATTIAEIAKTEASVEHALNLGRQTDVKRRIEMLHLRSTSAEQCSIMIAQLQRLSSRSGLRIMTIAREATPFMTQMRGSESSTYEIGLEGPYRNTLSALAAFAEMPLVANVKAVTFQRVPSARRTVGDVRTSIQLEVFRMTEINAPRSS